MLKFLKANCLHLSICAVLVLYAYSQFSDYFSEDHVLMTTDAVITSDSYDLSDAREFMQGIWHAGPMLGRGVTGRMSLMYMLILLLPAILWNNLNYCIGMLLSSFALYAFLVRRKLSPLCSVLGVLTACWVGSNMTLVYAGHVSKPFVIVFFALSLLLAGTHTLSASLLWGSCLGLMFVQQPDVGLFFAMFAGPYKLFMLWSSKERSAIVWAKNIVPALLVAMLFAAGSLLGGYKQHVKGTNQFQEGASDEKWEYVTQWSWPPEESIAFIAPGYTGWRSGEPEGPYWGRMGRSAGWEQTRQGFMNYKMETTYLGIIPVIFALFAVYACRRLKSRNEIIFWAISTALALLLSFGKYFPLYRLIYALPVVNNIRNPNKFLQVFQVCLAILSAYGFTALFSPWDNEDDKKKVVRRFFYGASAGVVLILVWAAGLTFTRGLDVSGVIKVGWPKEMAEVIVANKIKALWYASIFGLAAVLCFASTAYGLVDKTKRLRLVLILVILALVGVDAANVTKRYIKEMPSGYIENNSLTKFLKSNLGNERVAVASQSGIYNLWVTYLLPCNRIASFNFSSIPRMPKDYENFLKQGGRNPFRMWQLAGVKYLLAPTALEKQMPENMAQKVFAYNVLAKGTKGDFSVVQNPNGQHAVFELNNYVPRIELFQSWTQSLPAQELGVLFSPSHNIFTTLTVPNETAAALPQNESGKLKILKAEPNLIIAKTHASTSTILRIGNHYDGDWYAKIDGESVPLLRVDYMCQGVFIPPGDHEVVLQYAPSQVYLHLYMLGLVIAIGACVGMVARKKD